MLAGKGHHKPEFAYDIVRIHSPLIYRDLIEYNIVGPTKLALPRCFPFPSKLKAGILKPRVSTRTIRHLATYNSDCC